VKPPNTRSGGSRFVTSACQREEYVPFSLLKVDK
jgi:hypothetical protein